MAYLLLVRPVPHVAFKTGIAERFVAWLSTTSRQPLTVIAGPDPPDFLIEPQQWLEVSDIYLNNAQAKFLNSPNEENFSFEGSPDQLARRLLDKLDEKLGKTSYQKIHDERGRGILLLTCQDFFFDEVIRARLREALATFRPTNDRGFFRTAYFEYTLPTAKRVYDVIYSPMA